MTDAEHSKNKKDKTDFESEVDGIQSSYEKKGEKLPHDFDEKTKKNMEKTKEELEKLKKEFLKKHPYIRAIGILPPQGVMKFIEEQFDPVAQKEEVEKISKLIHLAVIIPEDKFKKVKEIRTELIKIVEVQKQKAWVHVMSHVDVFNYGLDGKYEHATDIGLAYPLYDKDFLANLRVAEFHKILILKKFERYVVSYVIAGSFVRGDTVKGSDVDTYVIIDDTDVKRMPRLELKEKLRGWIYRYIAEAEDLAGVKKVLNVQVYLLTEFWEAVKDAHPIMFTFIRDGIPLHDRGTFMPWKLLLKQGKLKPSPEAIDMFMASGDKLQDLVKRRLLDIVIGDIYWSVLTPSQALIMLYGRAPPTTKETPHVMKEIFYDKEGMLEKKYIDTITKVIKMYKDYEHQKLKEVSGSEVDKLMADALDYIKRLKELRNQIEKDAQTKTLEQIRVETLQLMEAIFGKKTEAQYTKLFEDELVKKGLIPQKNLKVLKEILKSNTRETSPKKKAKKGSDKKTGLSSREVDDVRKNASVLIKDLIEYRQRMELSNLERGRLRIKTDKEVYELVLTNKGAFLISKTGIQRVTNKLENTTEKEFSQAINEQANTKEVRTDNEVFHTLKKELGDYEITF